MDHEKHIHGKETPFHDGSGSEFVDEQVGVVQTDGKLSRNLKNRHMQSTLHTHHDSFYDVHLG